jgi:hypothetical protein
MAEDKPKRPIGRPSKYKPEYCERVVALAKDGCGWADYAAEFEVDRATLFRLGRRSRRVFAQLYHARRF